MELLQIRDRASVRELVLTRPSKRNALSLELLSALNDAFSSSDPIKAWILTGAAPVFSAGADLHELSGTSADIAFDDAVERTVNCIRASKAPVIAAIDGACIGAAFDIAMACDMTVAGPHAFFEFPPVKLGILYNPSAIQRMHCRLPRATLSRMLLTGERLTASEAAATGVATHFASDRSALELAHEIAVHMANFDDSALAATRRLLHTLDTGVRDLSGFTDIRKMLLDSPHRREKLDQRRK